MSALVRALHVFSRIAPLAGDEEAGVAAALSRALVRAGERVTVVTRRPPGLSDAAMESAGLARRLDPIEVPAPSAPLGRVRLTVREGSLAGGAVPAFALEGPGSEDDEILAAAALELAERRGMWPHVVRAREDAPHIIAQAEERAPPPGCVQPASVLLLGEASARPVPAPLRDALAAAHRIALPSASYAGEVIERGEGELVEMLRAKADEVRGIASGVDEAHWNPARDPHLADPLEPTRAGKAELKRALRRELGLAPGPGPLAVALGPFDLLDSDAAEGLAHVGAHLVLAHPPTPGFAVAGAAAGREPGQGQAGQSGQPGQAGQPGQNDIPLELARAHPMRVRSVHTDIALLHRIVAAADIVLHCHRFAPGGFSPLFSMLYGAVPVAPRSGAFADAVVDWDPGSRTGTGFLFSPYRPEDMPAAMRRAVRASATTEVWDELVARVTHADLTWRTVGVRHAELGREAMRAAHPAD
ncbi:MAG TPA: hypothetical protein VKB80_10710 [Kofleriaceae bacterium]|nr:hypothetical protein [Kofleriaceae bacterium]